MARESIPDLSPAKELGAAQQIEFDFFGGGNMSIAFQYQDAVTARLDEKAPTSAARDRALATLWHIVRNLGWQSFECAKTAADLVRRAGLRQGDGGAHAPTP